MESLQNIINSLDIYKHSNDNNEWNYYDNYHINRCVYTAPQSKRNKSPSPVQKEITTKKEGVIVNEHKWKGNNGGFVNVNADSFLKFPKKQKIQFNNVVMDNKPSKGNGVFNKGVVDFVMKNKQSIKDKERVVRENKLTKENEALKMMLFNKKHNSKYDNVSARVFNCNSNNNKQQEAQMKRIREIREKDMLNHKKINYIGGLFGNKDRNAKIKEVDHEDDDNGVGVSGGNEVVKEESNNNINEVNNNVVDDNEENIMKMIEEHNANIDKQNNMNNINNANTNNNDNNKCEENINNINNIKEQTNNNNNSNTNNQNNNIVLPNEPVIIHAKPSPSQNLAPAQYLTEEQKQQRITELNIEKQSLEQKLFSLPLTRLTQKMKDTKTQLETKLNEIDTELKLLSYKQALAIPYNTKKQ